MEFGDKVDDSWERRIRSDIDGDETGRLGSNWNRIMFPTSGVGIGPGDICVALSAVGTCWYGRVVSIIRECS